MPSADDRSARAAGLSGPQDVSESLRRLQRAEITLDEYLDDQTDRAVAHLDGLISAEHLAFIREMLREELTLDPVLVELVHRATRPVTTAPSTG